MAPKRQRDSSPSTGGKAVKKAKTRAARVIEVQSSNPGPPLPIQSAGASSSQVRFTENSLRGLPMTLEVEKFAEARSFEIGAMQKSMQSARDETSKRVWQTLPRHLRRRTASHDPRRVPVRLREKAMAEMDPVKRKKKLKALSKRGKTFDIGRTAQLLKRQKDKTWLETHIWHAKRMKMENMWGYRLAIQPTEKSFRPSHRASVHGSIIQDVSYYGVLELKGPLNVLMSILMQCCDPQGSISSASYTSGGRACETFIYNAGAYPFGMLSPCTMLWKPIDSTSSPDVTSSQRGKDISVERVLWLHVHPATFLEVHGILRKTAQAVITSEYPDVQIEVADLRGSINAFEVIGPKAGQVLSGALQLTKQAGPGRKAWNALARLQSPASVPRGMIIGAQVHDPRLSFPPTNVKLTDSPGNLTPFSITPSPGVACSEIWDDEVRRDLSKPKFTKKDLDGRRSKNLIPGTRLHPTQSDARIPLLLVQRSIAPSASATGTTPLHGYLLLFPAGWSMPFFSSLTHTGTRVGGLREHGTQRFEAGTPHFPQDFIGTRPYQEHWDKRSEEEKLKWERTPSAKRVPFDKLPDAGKRERVVWQPDWSGVLGVREDHPLVGASCQSGSSLIPTQPNDDMDNLLEALIREEAELPADPGTKEMHSGDERDAMLSSNRIWTLHGPSAPTLLHDMACCTEAATAESLVLTHINNLRSKRGLEPYPVSMSSNLTNSALVMVRVRMCGRGVPEDMSVIYTADNGDVDEDRWRAGVLRTTKGVQDDSHAEETEAILPEPEDIIGYVTTGHFSLQQGKGFALGAVSLVSLVAVMRKDLQMNRRKDLCRLVKIRERTSAACRLAWLEVNGP